MGIFGGSIEPLLNDISFVVNYSAYWDGLNNFRETVSARTGIQNIQTGDFKDIKNSVIKTYFRFTFFSTILSRILTKFWINN